MNNQNSNLELLEQVGVTNKTHIKILSKYHELKILRIIIFILAFISLMTSPSPYVATSAIIYIIFEAFLYRYDLNLRRMYHLTRNNGLLEREYIE